MRKLVVLLFIAGVALGAEPPAEKASASSRHRALLMSPKTVDAVYGALTFAGLRYRWVGDRWLLDRISPRAESGQSVFVQGAAQESSVPPNAICLIIKPISCVPRP